MKAYRIVAKIKNNRLWRAILASHPTVRNQADAARALGMKPSEIGELLNMRWFPQNKRGEYIPRIVRLCDSLGESPGYLFDPELYGREAAPIVVEIDRPALEAAGVFALPPAPDTYAIHQQLEQSIDKALGTLTPREEMVVRLRHGLDDGHEHTHEEIAERIGVSPVRSQQIINKAHRKLRHPSRSRMLRDYAS